MFDQELLPYVLITLISFSGFIALVRIGRNPASSLLDPRLIVLVSTIIYTAIPLIFLLISDSSTVYGESLKAQLEVANYVVYLLSVLFIVYLLGNNYMRFYPLLFEQMKSRISLLDFRIYYAMAIGVFAYSSIILALNVSDAITFFGDRAWSSAKKASLNNTYKLALSLYMLLGFVILLVMRSGKLRYFLFLTPYFLFDIVHADRSFIFIILSALLVMFVFIGGKLKLRYFFYIFIFLYSIEFFRASWNITALKQEGFSAFFKIPGELLGTTSATFIVYEAGLSTNKLEYFFSNIILFWLPNTLRPEMDFIKVADVLGLYSPFTWGLGGSVLSEVFILSSISYLYPFIIVLISIVYIVLIRWMPGIFGVILSLFVFTSMISFQRGGFISNGFLPLYYFLIFYFTLSTARFLFGAYHGRATPINADNNHDH